MATDTTAPLSLSVLLLNLFLGLFLSMIVAWYYIRFGTSLSNRTQFAPILPTLTLITLLVISVIKSSLALSLGLVGALSIVRFRTAIKEPEELILLFLAISIGLGLGADQRIPTLLAFVAIMAYLLVRGLRNKKAKRSHSLYMNILIDSDGSSENIFSKVNQLLLSELREVDLRRMDQSGQRLQMTYYVNVNDESILVHTMDSLRNALPGSSVSLVEQNNILGG